MADTAAPELDALEVDHRALIDIFQSARYARGLCIGTVDTCSHSGCPQGTACAQRTREHFHRVLFGCMGRFGKEESVLKRVMPPTDFQAHAACHADLMSRLHQVIALFTKNRNVPAAFDMLEAISRTYEIHHRTMDHRKNGPPADPASSQMPNLPLTGEAQIDSKLAVLSSILQQARTLCQEQHSDCTGCLHTLKDHCLENAIVLIGDTLKHMVEHFRHEDRLIRQTPSYVGRVAHLAAHAEISRQIGQMIDDFQDENTARCLCRLADTLNGWLKQHIEDYDLPLFSFRADNRQECR